MMRGSGTVPRLAHNQQTPVRLRPPLPNLAPSTIYTRLRRGWSREDAVSTPPHGKPTVTSKLRDIGLSRSTYYKRVARGLSVAVATGGDPVNEALRRWRR